MGVFCTMLLSLLNCIAESQEETSCPLHSTGKQRHSSQRNKHQFMGTEFTQQDSVGKSIICRMHLIVSHKAALSQLSPPGNQEADALTKMQVISSQLPLEVAHRVHVNSSHRWASLGWKIEKASGIPVKYSNSIYAVQSCEACLCPVVALAGGCMVGQVHKLNCPIRDCQVEAACQCGIQHSC